MIKEEEFLMHLRRELDGLQDSEVDEIISDYKELIREGLERGREGDEILSSFGSPREIAQQIKLQTQFDRFEQQSGDTTQKVRQFLRLLITLAVLAPLHFLALFFLLLVGGTTILSFWTTGLSLSLAVFILLPLVFVFWPLDLMFGITAFSATLSAACFLLFFLGLCYGMTLIFSRFIRNYVRNFLNSMRSAT